MHDLHLLTGAFAVDAVDDLERTRFERHLPSCRECVDEVDGLRAAAHELTRLGERGAPVSLRGRVLTGITTVRPSPPAPERPAVPHATVPAHRRDRASRPRWLGVAAAVVLLAGGAAPAVRHAWSSAGQQTLATQRVASTVLHDPSATHRTARFPGGASAEVVLSASREQAVMVTRNLPDAPDGGVYQLWLTTDHGFVSAGLLSHEADQVALLTGDASAATAVAITQEPPGGSTQPTSGPMALIPLTGGT